MFNEKESLGVTPLGEGCDETSFHFREMVTLAECRDQDLIG